MSTELKEKRKDSIIYSRITPISTELKSKVNTAFADFINRFKAEHLS